MNIKYNNDNRGCGGNSMGFFWGDPFAYKRATEDEMRLEYRNSKDPEQAPRPERGDIYIVICTIAGIIIGGAAGAIVCSHYFGFTGFLFGLFGGVIIGGTIGAIVGGVIKKRRAKPKTDEQKPF